MQFFSAIQYRYLSAEYEKNEEALQEYYDEVDVCQNSSGGMTTFCE